MFKSIFTLAAGTALAQFIYLLATPVLSRMYGPEDFGVLALILAISAIVGPFSTLRYDAAILLKDDDLPAGTLFILGFIVLCLVTLVFAQMNRYVGEYFFSEDIQYPDSIGMITVAYVFVLGVNALLTSWHSRFRRFRVVSLSRVVQAVATVVIQVFAAGSLGMLGLIYGHLVGLLIFAVIGGTLMLWWDGGILMDRRLVKNVRLAAIRYKNFPLYSTWSALLNGMVNHLPNILFVKLFTPVVAGHFAIATRLIRTPLSVIGQSIHHVTAQHAGENVNNRDKITDGLRLVLPRMAHYAVLPFVVMGYFLVPVVEFVLGEQWSDAGEYGRILLPWLFLTYMTWPLAGVYSALGFQRAMLGFNALFLLGVLISFSVALIGYGVSDVLAMLAITGGISRIVYAHWIIVVLDKRFSNRIVKLMLLYTILIGLTSF